MSEEVKQNGYTTSADDLAWADSCLAVDSVSQSGWESFRDALLDTLAPHSDSLKHKESDYCSGTDTEMISSSKESETSLNEDITPDNDASFNKDDNLGTENGDKFGSGFNLDNVFLPTYNESNRNIIFSDPEYELAFPAFKIDDESPKDIFKVWELGSAFEDEEFINEFNRTLSEKPLELLPAVADVSVASDDLRELDDLISGIADLSLVEGAA